MGGKNVYYFLTPMQRGRLQVLPLAYDVRRKEWFNATGSMIRHFGDAGDEQLDWTDSALTFNTSCYSCHVSQLSSNYDLATDTYKTLWAESGINCETCHGPAGEHVKVCKQSHGADAPEVANGPEAFHIRTQDKLLNDPRSDGFFSYGFFGPKRRYFLLRRYAGSQNVSGLF